jgi:hypothetical protein
MKTNDNIKSEYGPLHSTNTLFRLYKRNTLREHESEDASPMKMHRNKHVTDVKTLQLTVSPPL